MKPVFLLLCFAVSLFLLDGCASIVDGSNQNITVDTDPIKDAKCQLFNNKGSWDIEKTPGAVLVHRAYGKLTITCTKKGYEKENKTVQSNTKSLAYGNILLGGIIGGSVDMATGAAYDYPESIHVNMKICVPISK